MHAIIQRNLSRIKQICEANSVLSLAVFGSVTDGGRFTKKSDVDIYVDFDEDKLSLEAYTDAYFSVIESLEKILKRKVDLITRRSVKNPYFKDQVERTKVVIFNR